jgi:hypothetical protein
LVWALGDSYAAIRMVSGWEKKVVGHGEIDGADGENVGAYRR